MSTKLQRTLLQLSNDRKLAHAVLFKHRHPLETPDIHAEMIDFFHSPDPQGVLEAFRGAAKSTLGEEATCLQAQFMDWMNGVIVGATEDRAMERLEAIKAEIETNDSLIELFGENTGPVWQGRRVVLGNSVCLQAIGVGQKVRGLKYLQYRPQWIWLDDIEDDESTKTPESSHQRLRWLYKTLLPICAKGARVRVSGNRLSPDAVITKLANNKAWVSRRYPIVHFDILSGKEVPTWPGLYDAEWIINKRQEYEDNGLHAEWASEYMCEAMAEATRTFNVEDIRVIPRVRTWQPAQAIWDPARTSQGLKHQSQYAKCVFSWIGRKLVIWKLVGQTMKPSEMMDDIFKTDNEFNCISLFVEEDGLNEWLMEPLRLEQANRRHMLPHLEAVRAPRDKDNFIRSLEPFLISHEIEFAEEFPEVRVQMINFPAGRKDILNVLAYALKLRPGQPIYEGFAEENVIDAVDISLRSRRYLCVNADGTFVTAVLVQYDGVLTVMGDWIETGDPGQCLMDILKQARLAATSEVSVIVHPKEIDKYQNKGTVAALRRIPVEFQNGNTPDRGRAEIRDLMGKRRDRPLFQVLQDATWTLRAMTGGYCKAVNAEGHPEGWAKEGAYRTMMEGLESFAGIMHHEAEADGVESGGLYRTGRHGQTYRSLIGGRR